MTKCIKCKQEKEETEFVSNRGNVRERCKSCCKEEYDKRNSKMKGDYKAKYMQKWKDNNPEYMRSYRKTNHKSRAAYNKKWKIANREKYLDRRKKYREKIKIERPERHFLNRIQNMLNGATRRTKSQGALNAFGVSSIEEFISKMSNKTENQNWIQDYYQLDHIWQLNWFDHKLKDSEFDFSQYSSLLNHHSNLRPLRAEENGLRSPLDFSPLNFSDLNKYESILNDFIASGIKFYFENPELFSGDTINKGDDEESVIIEYLKGLGYKIDYYTGLRFSPENKSAPTNR